MDNRYREESHYRSRMGDNGTSSRVREFFIIFNSLKMRKGYTYDYVWYELDDEVFKYFLKAGRKMNVRI